MLSNKPIFIILGFPGAGKDTQADLLSSKLSIPHIGAGKAIKEYLDSNPEIYKNNIKAFQGGPTNPTKVLMDAIYKKLSQLEIGDRGFVLTINPNSKEELEFEINEFRSRGLEVRKIFYLDIDRDTAIDRAVKRLNGVYTDKEPDFESLVKRIDNYIPTITEAVEYAKSISILDIINGHLEVSEIHEILIRKILQILEG